MSALGDPRRQSRMERDRKEAFAEGLAAAALVLAPLALGMVHLPVVLAISGLAWLALGLLVIARGPKPLRIGWFGAALLGLAFATALHLVPLPFGLVRLLSPETARINEIALGPAPGPRPLSLDLPATWTALVKALGMAAAAVVLQHRSTTSSRARRRVRLYVVATTTAVVLLGLFHFALAERQTFLGLYTFRSSHHFRTSFGNANHLAGFLSLGGLVALGMAVHARSWKSRVLGLTTFLGAGAGVVLSASRGGFLALLAGLFVFGTLAWIQRTRGKEESWRSWLTFGAATALATCLAVWIYVEFPRILREIETLLSIAPENEAGKVEAARTAWEAAKVHWLTGIGRGAFESAGTHYQTRPFPNVWFTHAENEALQALAELGFPLGGALVLCFALGWIGVVRLGLRSLGEAGVAAGTFALALQNLVDFGLQGASGLAFAVLLAAPAAKPLALSPWLGRAAAALGAVLIAVGSVVAWPGLEEENRRLVEARVRGTGELAARVENALRRRPADWVPVDRMATHLLYEEDDPAQALHWINKQLLLYPQGGRGHELAGVALARLGRDRQARRSFQAAAERGVPTIEHVLEFTDEPQALLQAIPRDPERAGHAIQRLLRRGHAEVALEAARRGLERHPDSPPLLRALYAVQLGRRDFEQALEVAQRLRRVEGDSPLARAREAEALVRLKRFDEARDTYARALDEVGADFRLVLGWASLELDQKRPARALEVLERLPITTDEGLRRRYHVLRARAFRDDGSLVRARDEYRLALKLDPDSESLRIALADVLGELAEFSEASRILEPLDPERPPVRAAISRLERRRKAYSEERGIDLERLLR